MTLIGQICPLVETLKTTVKWVLSCNIDEHEAIVILCSTPWSPE
jgi:hypothetical protein